MKLIDRIMSNLDSLNESEKIKDKVALLTRLQDYHNDVTDEDLEYLSQIPEKDLIAWIQANGYDDAFDENYKIPDNKDVRKNALYSVMRDPITVFVVEPIEDDYMVVEYKYDYVTANNENNPAGVYVMDDDRRILNMPEEHAKRFKTVEEASKYADKLAKN